MNRFKFVKYFKLFKYKLNLILYKFYDKKT